MLKLDPIHCDDVKTSVVVLETGLGLETGLKTIF